MTNNRPPVILFDAIKLSIEEREFHRKQFKSLYPNAKVKFMVDEQKLELEHIEKIQDGVELYQSSIQEKLNLSENTARYTYYRLVYLSLVNNNFRLNGKKLSKEKFLKEFDLSSSSFYQYKQKDYYNEEKRPIEVEENEYRLLKEIEKYIVE